MGNLIRSVTLTDALALIDDPQVRRIAEYLWVKVWMHDPSDFCEVASHGDGQWNYCMDDAAMINDLFKEMLTELGSA